jgi:signal transduction histidine kinase
VGAGGPLINGAYLLFPVSAGALLSVAGARYLDLHRLAIFREATLREAEAQVSRGLVGIAKEINGSLDAADVLDRITAAIRSALGCDWTSIMLRDERREVFRLVATSGPVPAALRQLEGIDFGSGAFPLVDRLLAQHYVEIGQIEEADPATASFMRHWDCRSLLAARLSRGGEAVGILVAGTKRETGGVDEITRQLFRGIAEHAAIALNNVRLIEDLRQADRLKSDFLSTMSHELRTPLNVIIGYADLLLDGAFGAIESDQQQVLGRVSENAHSLLELISATLEVNRIEAGRARLQLREVSLRRLINELQHDTGHLPRHPGVSLLWEGPGPDVKLRTDPSKLKIILKNLVGNALKFTEHGHVVVRTAYDRRAEQVNVQVQDTGAGIAPHDLPHIFVMFRQGDGKHQHSGVGLGLYIVKRFVEQLGGRISVRSKLGEGSTFQMSIPAAVAAADDERVTPLRRELVA